MCGIAGVIDRGGGRGGAALPAVARAMGETLRHRGPDDGGVWHDGGAGVALAHRRLSVIDLSAAGRQPMVSACGRYVLAYNGEIYNHGDLRARLAALGHVFRGHSDTETMVEAFSRWGIREAVESFIGMFAFAVWDRLTRTLTLVRDRLGIKPLYWGEIGGLFVFGSELKALLAASGERPAISRAALTRFLRHNYVPAPQTIFEGVWKLAPGTMLVLAPGETPRTDVYWSLLDKAEAGERDPLRVSAHAATETLEDILGDAVERRMVADVPLGVFLSGGIDSSTVAALMQARSSRPVRTFSIGFAEAAYDESAHAAAVARHLGTEHTALVVTPDEARDVIPKLADIYDEPFADSSQIPTCLLAALTREHVTVALSGDGGDEVFGGYVRYQQARRLEAIARYVPEAVLRAGASGIRALPPGVWDQAFTVVPSRLRPAHPGDKMHKLAGVLAADRRDHYRMLVSQWQDPGALVPGGAEPDGDEDPMNGRRLRDPISRMRYRDFSAYLPDDILTKVDRATMAVGLEARVRLLDHRVVEFAWRLPRHFLVKGGRGKWLLRQVLARHVPPSLTERAKMGFGIPVGPWLRSELREWAADLLAPENLNRHGLIRPQPVQDLWARHQDGMVNGQYALWGVLMFQAWWERWAGETREKPRAADPIRHEASGDLASLHR